MCLFGFFEYIIPILGFSLYRHHCVSYCSTPHLVSRYDLILTSTLRKYHLLLTKLRLCDKFSSFTHLLVSSAHSAMLISNPVKGFYLSTIASICITYLFLSSALSVKSLYLFVILQEFLLAYCFTACTYFSLLLLPVFTTPLKFSSCMLVKYRNTSAVQ